MIYVYDKSTSPLTVQLDKGGYGGLSLVDIWIKDAGDADFVMYGSCSGEDGTWRKIDELQLPKGGEDNIHKSYTTSYRYIKVVNNSETESEIEIVAGT